MADDTNNEELILTQYFQDQFHVPTPGWWEEANLAFQTLQKLLDPSLAGPEEDLDSQDQGGIPSARRARIGALPKLVCFATESHAIQCTTRNETLECVVFGTISASLFIDVFWEAIQKAQVEYPDANIVVSSVQPGAHPVFVVRINSFTFEVQYGCCEPFVRRIHNKLPQSIPLAALQYCDEWSSKQAIRILWLTDFAQKFSIDNTLHHVYHYIRAWATVQGLYASSNIGSLTSIAIIALLRHALSSGSEQHHVKPNASDTTDQNWENSIIASLSSGFGSESSPENLDFKTTIRKFFTYYGKVPDIDLTPYHMECGTGLFNDDEDEHLTEDQITQWINTYDLYHLQNVDRSTLELLYLKFQLMHSIIESAPTESYPHFSYWKNLLASIQQQDVPAKLVGEDIIQIDFVYSGTSSLECGRWLDMLGDRLVALRSSLTNLTSSSSSSSSPSILHLWPQPLVDQEADDSSPFYEGCFLLGLTNIDSLDLNPTLEKWLSSLQKDKSTPPNQKGYLSYTMHTSSFETAHLHLRPSTRTFHHPPITPPNTSLSTFSPTPTPSATPTPTPTQKSPPLRTAKDILHRLLHDPSYSIENHLIGYRDRHAGVMFKNASDWKLDTMDEEWIPEHKILYFIQTLPDQNKNKNKKRFIWHREQKLDLLFGSGGSISRWGIHGEKFNIEVPGFT
ncbi:hypothetical protein BELL_0040g00060 [Botrytis elliptica]|uniref:MJ1316 RNA cyclic group end recognition domain-containing protein n=1 Tax=Botrytis elliptica TaxID=278938 RepID=A0A4Z1K6R3_9HELO|nr:hypothetical protein EAE99_004411 [Botrytis elliptica]TGO79202.1 hypothetical protein BELL_0040g00060 [Botrytis elliptica]